MPNSYYNVSTTFIPGTKVRSDQVNIEYQALEAAFDLLPTSTASLTLNTATFGGVTGGSGDNYTLTMPDTRTSYTDGEEIVFIADRVNTGAATMNVDGVGVVPLVRFDGSALPAGDVQSGLIHVARYDNVNSRFQMLSPALSAVSSAVDAALSAAAAQSWAIEAENVPVPIIYGGDGVSTFSSFHWAQKALAAPTLQRINTDIVTATPPTTEAVTGQLQFYDADDTDLLAYVGFNASNLLNFYNQMRGGQVQLAATDAAGAGRFGFIQDPDGTTSVWGDTGVTLLANSTTVYDYVVSTDEHHFYQATSPAITSGQPMHLRFKQAGGTDIGEIFWGGGVALNIYNRTHGGQIDLGMENAAGTFMRAFRSDPGSNTWIYHKGNTRIITLGGLGGDGTGGIRISCDTGAVDRYIEGYGAGRIWLIGNLDSDSAFYLRANENSALVRVQGTTSVGATVDILQGDPDGSTTIYNPASAEPRIVTGSSGQVRVLGSTANGLGNSQQSYIELMQSDSTGVAKLGFDATANFIIRSLNHGATMSFRAEDTLGTEQFLFNGDPDGAFDIYHDGLKRIATNPSGVLLLSDTSPGIGSVQNARLTLQQADGTAIGRVGFASASSMEIRSLNEGGNINLIAEDAAGVAQSLFVGDPDGTVDLYADGAKRFSTEIAGHITVFGPGNADAENRYLAFKHANGTRRAFVGHLGSDVLRVRNEIHGAKLIIDAEDLAGTVNTILDADPDGVTILRAESNLELECNGGENALIATSNADVALYYDNVETFRTADEDADTNGTGAEIRHADQAFYPVGMNVSAGSAQNSSFSAAATWLDLSGHSILKTTTATPTYTTPGSTDSVLPNGALWNIHNIGTSGNITVAPGSGVTLTWQDGAGGTTGSRTISPGSSATLWKRNDTNWYLYGNGIA